MDFVHYASGQKNGRSYKNKTDRQRLACYLHRGMTKDMSIHSIAIV